MSSSSAGEELIVGEEIWEEAPVEVVHSGIYPPLPPMPSEHAFGTRYCGTACDLGGECGSGYCGPDNYWGRIEFLLWWGQGMDLPPLASTGPLPAGNILFGDEEVADSVRPGGRGTLGAWIDDCHVFGVGVRYFALGSETTEFDSAGLDGVVGRPFFQVAPLVGEDFLPVNDPAQGIAGRVMADTDSDVHGGEIFFRLALKNCPTRRYDLFVGYQGAQLEEELRIRHSIRQGNNTFTARDEFNTVNEFHGCSVGLQGEFYYGCWTFEALGKVGLGNMNQVVTIRGESTENGAESTGGLLALASNSGVFGRDEFGALPEVNLLLAYHASERLAMTCGYSFLYWNNVLRPGDQIDRLVNTALLPGPGQVPGADPARPRFRFNDSDFWLHGISFGIQGVF